MRHNNTEAVSPVIGVILMVAITVILAAVIAAFVFGMANNLPQNTRFVMVKADQVNGSAVSLINMGGQDQRGLSSIDVTGDIKNPGSLGIPMASTKAFILSDGIGPKQIIVTGTWLDGTQQVLLTSTVQRTV